MTWKSTFYTSETKDDEMMTLLLLSLGTMSLGLQHYERLLQLLKEMLQVDTQGREVVILIFIALDLNLNQTVVNHFQY